MQRVALVLTTTLLALPGLARAAGPCAGGGWGDISNPNNAVHVAVDGNDKNDGSSGKPLATLAVALLATRAGGPQAIAVHPGSFTTNLELYHVVAGSISDDDLVIEGCSPQETTLASGHPGKAVLSYDEVDSLVLRGVELSGGDRALRAFSGANGALTDVVIDGASRAGVVLDEATLSFTEVKITNTTTSSGSAGWGISVNESTLDWSGGGVDEAVEFGIFAHDSDLTLDDLDVTDIDANASGYLGRGLHMQEGTADLDDVRFARVHDAAVFGRRVDDATLVGIVDDDTQDGLIPSSSDKAAEGIVMTRAGSTAAVSNFTVSLEDCDLDNNNRAAVLLDGVTATLDGTTGSGNGGPIPPGWSAPAVIYYQDSAAVSGPDLSEPHTVAHLDGSTGLDPLDLYMAAFAPQSY